MTQPIAQVFIVNYGAAKNDQTQLGVINIEFSVNAHFC